MAGLIMRKNGSVFTRGNAKPIAVTAITQGPEAPYSDSLERTRLAISSATDPVRNAPGNGMTIGCMVRFPRAVPLFIVTYAPELLVMERHVCSQVFEEQNGSSLPTLPHLLPYAARMPFGWLMCLV